MKQILQNLSSGETMLAEVPAPKVAPGQLLIETEASLVSLGTERMLIDFGKANWLQKARQQPEKVKQVIQKIKTDGLGPTLDVVRARLDTPLALGYCNVGRVIAVGDGVEGFSVGDRVLSNSSHAEVVRAPKNLCAKVPEGVAPREAVFAVVGAIGLQGIRLLKPTLGETFVVMGLGLIGQLSVQILRATGCRVIGVDMDPEKCRLAESFGASCVDVSSGADPVKVALSQTSGKGVDGVLITASTKSDEVMEQAARMCRKRGRIVLVGVVGLKLNRSDFYDKELSFQVSCAYGPGRYDPEYEDKGRDYPFAFVRWTEQRNFEAVLGLLAEKKIQTGPLTTHRFPFAKALDAYGNVGQSGVMGIVLEYDTASDQERKLSRTVVLPDPGKRPAAEGPVVGLLGAGGFTGLVMLPALKKTGVRLKSIASSTGVSAAQLGKKFGFEHAVSENEEILGDPEINTVFITTRHANHGTLVERALKAGKHVFVEKPLCLTREELGKIAEFFQEIEDRREEIGDRSQESGDRRQGAEPAQSLSLERSEIPTSETCRESPISHIPSPSGFAAPSPISHIPSSRTLRVLSVGFNRRFAPLVQRMKELVRDRVEPMSMVFQVNAGVVPPEHWSQQRDQGGGRILGEGCHFIDTLRFLAGCPIRTVQAVYASKRGSKISDIASINLTFEDGSIGTVHYFGNGNKDVPREQIDLYCGGGILRMDNFRSLTGYQWPGFRKQKLRRQDKGHAAEVAAFIEAVRTGQPSPIPLEEIFEVTEATLQADETDT